MSDGLMFSVVEPKEPMINGDYNWHEFHGLMSVMKAAKEIEGFIHSIKQHNAKE